MQAQGKLFHARAQSDRPSGGALECGPPLTGPANSRNHAFVAILHIEEGKRAVGRASAVWGQYDSLARLDLSFERQKRTFAADVAVEVLQLDRLAGVAGAQSDIERLHVLKQWRVLRAEVLEPQYPLHCRVALECGHRGGQAQAGIGVGPTHLVDGAGRSVLGLGGTSPMLEEGSRGGPPVTE